MTEDELKALVKESMKRFDALTPERQALHRQAQRDSWIRGEMVLSRLVKKHTARDGSTVYEDYESYCLD